jgi:hypothetical protein
VAELLLPSETPASRLAASQLLGVAARTEPPLKAVLLMGAPRHKSTFSFPDRTHFRGVEG